MVAQVGVRPKVAWTRQAHESSNHGCPRSQTNQDTNMKTVIQGVMKGSISFATRCTVNPSHRPFDPCTGRGICEVSTSSMAGQTPSSHLNASPGGVQSRRRGRIGTQSCDEAGNECDTPHTAPVDRRGRHNRTGSRTCRWLGHVSASAEPHGCSNSRQTSGGAGRESSGEWRGGICRGRDREQRENPVHFLFG